MEGAWPPWPPPPGIPGRALLLYCERVEQGSAGAAALAGVFCAGACGTASLLGGEGGLVAGGGAGAADAADAASTARGDLAQILGGTGVSKQQARHTLRARVLSVDGGVAEALGGGAVAAGDMAAAATAALDEVGSEAVVVVHAPADVLGEVASACEAAQERQTDLLTLAVVGVCEHGAAALAAAAEVTQRARAACAIAAPAQSAEMRAGVRERLSERALLTALRCEGAARRDAVERCDARDVVESGCNGAVPASALLPIIAYKLGRAPKYGA